MARTSRKKNIEESVQAVAPSQVFPTAIYARLSVENSGKDDDGAALENQIAVCEEYVKSCPHLKLIETYSDNGRTGTIFDRPGFNRLMDDIRGGRIKCLVVRDLSRFGRDYVETGTYIERIFPQLDVRFISVKENFDSFATDGSNESLMIPLQNLINDLYSKDISRKVSTALRIQMENGEFRWRKLPYGYMWNEDRTHIIPNEVTAPFVRSIFAWKLEGLSVPQILDRLEAANAPIPETLQRVDNNLDGVNTVCWSKSTLSSILKNPAYVGDFAVGRSRKAIYAGLKETQIKDPAEWYITSDAHEGLVSREAFQAVQRMMGQASDERKTKMERSKEKRDSLIDLFDGKIFCADCKQRMYFHRHKIDKDKRGRWLAHYECSTYAGRRAVRCTAHRTRSDVIEEKVLRALQLHIQVALDYEKLIAKMNESNADKRIRKELEKSIQSVTLKLRAISQKRTRLYEDFADGILSDEEYAYAKTSFDERWETLNRQLDELTAKKSQYSETMSGENKWIRQMKSVEVTDTLTKAIVDATIEKVFIHENKAVEIIFKYHDIFKQTERYLAELSAKEGDAK